MEHEIGREEKSNSEKLR